MFLSSIALLVVLLLMSVSCTGILVLHIEVENRTDQTLTITVDDERTFDVEAGKTVKESTGIALIVHHYFDVRAQNTEGKILLNAIAGVS
jgi:hypothetical protein